MPSPIDYRYASKFPTERLYAAIVDPAYLSARLTELGGRDAAVIEHRADANGASYRLRHELDTAGMPAMVRSLLSSDLVIERTETWTTQPDGSHRGTVTVGVVGAPVPASATGEQFVKDAPEGSEHAVHAKVTVSVPLFGGRIEDYVAGQVRSLLELESQFTTRWLEQHAT